MFNKNILNFMKVKPHHKIEPIDYYNNTLVRSSDDFMKDTKNNILLGKDNSKAFKNITKSSMNSERRFYSPNSKLMSLKLKVNDKIIEEMAEIRPILYDTDMLKVLEIFRKDKKESFFPVLDENFYPVGIIKEISLKEYVYSKYGHDLLTHPSKKYEMKGFISECPAVDVNSSINKLISIFAEHAHDEGVLITAENQYVGFLRLKSIIKLAHQREVQLVEEHNKILKQKNNDIQNTLKNMQQGIFTILQGNIVHHEYSSHLEILLETDQIADKNAVELLFSNSSIGKDQLDQIEVSLSNLIGEDIISFELNSHLLINEFVKYFPQKRKKILELFWNPIVNDNDQVEKLMVVIKDVTEFRKLQEENDINQKELNIIGQILSISNKNFDEFIQSSRLLLSQNENIVNESNNPDIKTIELLFRNMHTIKGNSRFYSFNYITDIIHKAEQTYNMIRKNELGWNKDLILEEIKDSACIIDCYENIYKTKLAKYSESKNSNYVSIDKKMLEHIKNCLNIVDTQSLCQLQNMKNNFECVLDALHTQRLESLLDGIINGLPSIAKELGKELPEIKINDNGIRFYPNAVPVLQTVFSHIFRNSIDHGLENKEERIAKGKNANGCIKVTVAQSTEEIYIICYDDGKGLNLDKIKAKAVESGLISSEEKLTDNDIAEFIFKSGITTSSSVSHVSGRGVGMDAVKEILQANSGNIEIQFTFPFRYNESNRNFQFLISLPMKYAFFLNE